MAEMQALERATIEVKNGQIELLRSAQEIKSLVLKQATQLINIRIAQRDETREQLALANMLSEINTLTADMIRAMRLAENLGGTGWNDSDIRDVLTSKTLIADESFFRAQV